MTGATFSSTHYQEYQETGNKNLFEEVIEKMILEGVAGMNESTMKAIKNIPPDKKRMAILRLLMESSSSHIQMFQKIKGLVNKDISRLEHISDIISLLRDYVEVGDVEKEKFGEVMTPLKLVTDMLSNLPKEIWSNPNLKICDPSNGTGIYPMVAIHALMKGLKGWEPDEEKRYKHIVENMIYACELQPKNTFLYLCAIDPFDQYDINVYTGSFLDEGFDFHMKNVWGLDEFNLIMANPPYNSDRNITDSQNTKDIYTNFIEKSYELSDGYVTMITKSNWMNFPKHKNFRERMINEYNIEKIFHFKENPFKGTEISGGVSYFVINKKNKKDTFELNGVTYNRKSTLDFLPYELDMNELIVMEKINRFEKIKLTNYRSQGWYGIKTNDARLSKNSNGKDIECNVSEQKGKIMFFPVQDLSNKMLEDINKYKIFSTSNYGANPYSLGRIFKSNEKQLCSESLVNWVFDDEITRDFFFDYLNTKLFRFCVSLVKNKQNISKNTFSLVPNIDFSKLKKVDDESVYTYLNLTEEDISTIESRCKTLKLLK